MQYLPPLTVTAQRIDRTGRSIQRMADDSTVGELKLWRFEKAGMIRPPFLNMSLAVLPQLCSRIVNGICATVCDRLTTAGTKSALSLRIQLRRDTK
jgi:hypothetical protein